MIITDSREAVATLSNPEINLMTPSDRRLDIDAKQIRIAELLQSLDCEGLLVLDPVNFTWLTSGGQSRGVLDPGSAPVLYFSAEGRWVICANVDTQRLFDEELDLLGFQLKEWPWYAGREQLLRDLCQNRKIASDLPFGEARLIGDVLGQQRRKLSAYESACYRALGQVLGHALEATCRTMSQGDSEREVAGQLSHRLVHRGVQPLQLTILADGRSTTYRQAGFTPTPVKSHAVVLAAVQKYGLCAMASRSVAFGKAPSSFRKEHEAACRVGATYTASSWPDAMPKQVLTTARRIYQVTGAEHEWRLCPQGHVTGHALVELPLLPTTEELFQSGWAITWRASIGAALSCDTFLISEDGPRTMTIAESWPLLKIRVQGAEFVRPDILVR